MSKLTSFQVYSSTSKNDKKFIKWCESWFVKYNWKYKGEVIKSAPDYRHRDIKVVGIRKHKSIRQYSKVKTFLYRTVINGELHAQYWKFEQTFNGFEEQLRGWIVNLEVYGTHFRVASKPQHNSKVREGYSLALGHGYSMNDSRFGNPYVYSTNWIENIKYTDFKYLDLGLFSTFMDPHRLERLYKFRTQIEYSNNINAIGIYNQIIDHSYDIDMRTVNLKWLINNKHKLKNSVYRFNTVNLINRIEERGKVVPGIEEIVEAKHIKYIPKSIGIVKWQNWAIKNKIDVNLYIDYLSVLKDLEISDTSTGTIIPSCLITAHDKAVSQLNSLKKERQREIDRLKDEEYQKTLQKRLKYNYVGEEYCVLIPNKLSEIINEGAELKHCVGGSIYLDQHREGKTTILFVRKKDQPEKSLYTLEYKNNEIQQLRGIRNTSAPEHVISFINEVWKPSITENFDGKSSGLKHQNQ